MIPEPGFQKPIPYLLETEERKSKTSFDCELATAKSVSYTHLDVYKRQI